METLPGNDPRASGADQNPLREFAERYARAWCSQNAASVAAHFCPDGSLTANGTAPSVGRGAIEVFVQQFMTAFPDLQISLDDIVAVGDGSEFHWTLTGTFTGPGGAGQRVCIKGYEEWRMGEDMLIAESHGHFDKADFQRQMAKSATA